MKIDVWLYRSGKRTHALTIAADGQNLPEHLGPWSLVRATVLEGEGFDVTEARWLIVQHGYVCFD